MSVARAIPPGWRLVHLHRDRAPYEELPFEVGPLGQIRHCADEAHGGLLTKWVGITLQSNQHRLGRLGSAHRAANLALLAVKIDNDPRGVDPSDDPGLLDELKARVIVI